MKIRAIIFIIGFLIFVQLICFNFFQMANIKSLKDYEDKFYSEIQKLEAKKNELTSRRNQLKNLYLSLPEYITISNDPEIQLLKALDDIKAIPSQDISSGSIKITSLHQYKEKPVSHHRSDFIVLFKLIQVEDAYKVINYFLSQKESIIEVSSLDIKRNESIGADGSMLVSLIIPPKTENLTKMVKQMGER